MFNWYMNAEVCYVYLTDMAEDGSISECRWFNRGWTLQELIAPTCVEFYDKKWQFISDKISISSELARITGIDESLLRCGHSLDPPLSRDHVMKPDLGGNDRCSCGKHRPGSTLMQLRYYCVAQKMSWASRRETTRAEDKAYCLMGLFQVNMPLLYGEGGNKAFFRLEKEILVITHDQSILAIDYYEAGSPWAVKRALASYPDQFRHSGNIHFRSFSTSVAGVNILRPMTTDLTKLGVDVELLLAPRITSRNHSRHVQDWFGILDFQVGNNLLARPAIMLRLLEESEDLMYCERTKGLFEISPEHPHRARDLAAHAWETSSDRKEFLASSVMIELTFEQWK